MKNEGKKGYKKQKQKTATYGHELHSLQKQTQLKYCAI